MANSDFKDDFIERLKFNNDLVSVVSKYVNLQQKGKNHWGCCPFHNEKTPSFSVNSVDQYYHCFGCKETGDAITFVQKMEGLDFISAIKLMADWSGMEMPNTFGDDKIKDKMKKKKEIFSINKDVALHYFKNMTNPKADHANKYLTKRGLNKETIKKFGIGVSLDWKDVAEKLLKKYKKDMLIEANIISEKNGVIFDVMAHRIIFPIIDTYDNVIGFSGRAINKTEFAKYKNTSQNHVFDKSRVVYGINNIKKMKQKNLLQDVILVEGQMDVIALFNAGIYNAAATMGTAITKYHAKEIKRFTDKIFICFDGDEAGKSAALKSLDTLKDSGLNVYVAEMPDGIDPDDFIKKHGTEKFKNIFKDALYMNDYKYKVILNKFNLSKNEDTSKFINECFKFVTGINTISEQQIYIKKISDDTKIDIYTLQRDFDDFKSTYLSANKRIIETRNNEASENKEAIETDSSELFVVSYILHKKEYNNLIDLKYITDEMLNKIYSYILDKYKSKNVIVSDIITKYGPDNDTVKKIVSLDFDAIKNSEQYFKDSVIKCKLKHLLSEQKKLIKKLDSISSDEKKKLLMKDIQNMMIDIKNIKKGEQ